MVKEKIKHLLGTKIWRLPITTKSQYAKFQKKRKKRIAQPIIITFPEGVVPFLSMSDGVTS